MKVRNFDAVKSDVVVISEIGVFLMQDTKNKKPVVRVDVFKPTARSKKFRYLLNNFKNVKKAIKFETPNYIADAEMMPDGLSGVPISSFKVEKVETTTKTKKEVETPKKEVEKVPFDKSVVKVLKTKHGKVKVVAYSERSFAIFGETKPFSKKLKGNKGFSYNPALTDEKGKKKAGWIVSKKNEELMYKILNKK